MSPSFLFRCILWKIHNDDDTPRHRFHKDSNAIHHLSSLSAKRKGIFYIYDLMHYLHDLVVDYKQRLILSHDPPCVNTAFDSFVLGKSHSLIESVCHQNFHCHNVLSPQHRNYPRYLRVSQDLPRECKSSNKGLLPSWEAPRPYMPNGCESNWLWFRSRRKLGRIL